METFGKAFREAAGTSATVTRVGRVAGFLAATGLLLAGATTAVLLSAGPAASVGTTSTTAATATTATTTSPAPTVLVVSGHGWGHGLGMSQYGAYGYAKHGWTYDRILMHYYSGTTIGQAKVTTVRVLLASGKKLTLNSGVAWAVTDSTGTKAALAAGVLVLKPKLAVTGQPALVPPFTFTARQPIVVDDRPYRGKLVVSSDGKRVQAVDVVGVEPYIKGVVASEMPSSWAPEALKAQAVAARSYALASITKGRDFDLYGDTRSQVYGGVDAESPNASDAVDATKGEVVLYNGKVADTLFFSTSGGRTASAAESTGTAVPYLVPVADPYDTLSPYHDWGPVLFDAAIVTKQLKLPAPLADVQAVNGASGRVKTVTVVAADDTQTTLTGPQLRSVLELRSTWFTPSLLQLTPAAKTITYGGAVSLTGFARHVEALSLESKTTGVDWAPAGELLLDGSGAFATIVKPQIGTQYRLAWGDVRAGLAKIAVAARVDATVSAAGAQGGIRPVASGAAVQLQQSAGTAWTTVATTVTDPNGAWSFAGPLTPGTYRVRAAPGHGIAAGVSPAAVVS
jgi:stage II sporulation protein D